MTLLRWGLEYWINRDRDIGQSKPLYYSCCQSQLGHPQGTALLGGQVIMNCVVAQYHIRYTAILYLISFWRQPSGPVFRNTFTCTNNYLPSTTIHFLVSHSNSNQPFVLFSVHHIQRSRRIESREGEIWSNRWRRIENPATPTPCCKRRRGVIATLSGGVICDRKNSSLLPPLLENNVTDDDDGPAYRKCTSSFPSREKQVFVLPVLVL